MQYILSELEYRRLKEESKIRLTTKKDELQRLCTLAAKYIPVEQSWRGEGKWPWGCILDPASNPGYCDKCPVLKICPYDWKEYSK